MSAITQHLPPPYGDHYAKGGPLVLAFMVNKAAAPIRMAITVTATPPLARLLARRGVTWCAPIRPRPSAASK
jgi:hypothetical protein